MERPVLVSMERVRRLQTILACFWIAMSIYTFASGEFRRQSMLRNSADGTLGVLSVWMLWELWRTREPAAGSQDARAS